MVSIDDPVSCAALRGAPALGGRNVPCLGVIAVGQQRVFVLFFTLSTAGAAACLRLLCVDDVLGRAVPLTTISAEAGGVVGKVWSAEQARASRVQHFLEQVLHDSWDYAAERSGRLTAGIRRAVAYATTTTQSAALEIPGAVYSACARPYVVRCS